ncbi:phage portal protein [Paracoccus yeei]|uniref:phage portal protein n=1 Tax=Paracoccus yeei TaxID=147645 RepID=UPI00174AED25|nr:phage portal protein [Paracoccus yeei]
MSGSNLNNLLGSAVSPDVPVQMQSPDASAVASGGVAYDGASKFDQLNTWYPPLRSADADLLPEKPTLDARSRNMFANDAYVQGGATIQKDAVVGAVYRLNAKPQTKVLWGKEDDTWEEEFQEEVETKFSLWAESPRNWPDSRRRGTLTDLVRLAVGTHVTGGEVLGIGDWQDDGRPYASSLLMIDADRLSNPMNGSANDKMIRGGVELNRLGQPVAYHIRNRHPSDLFGGLNAMLDVNRWARVRRETRWGRQNVLHLFEQLRPDQSRGVAAVVTALTEMRMLKHFRKTELQRAVIAATYAASIETDLPKDAMLAMGAGEASENPYIETIQQMMELMAGYSDASKNLHMEGAKIPVFVPNTHLKIQNPGASSPAGDKFEASMLRYIAASLGVSYEQLSRDYTQTNYSSARASIGEALRGMLPKKRMVADATANFVYRLWLEEAVNYNQLETLKRHSVPNFYDGLNAEAFANAEWIGAGQGQIDPLKETQAAVLKIKSGLSTQEHEIARISGGDWRSVKRQIARERALDEKYGNPSIYDSNDTTDMENSLSGSPREASE